MRVLDLFSGVGMFAYGMEKAGHQVVAFCEIEEWPRRVLAKHWPDVVQYTDVRELTVERLQEDGVLADTAKLVRNERFNERCKKASSGKAVSGETGTGGCDCGSNRPATIDIITAGFPCQDLSVAGKQAGIHGERSGLFDEILRIACDLRAYQGHLPILVLENVAALLTGAGGEWARYVFGRLAEIGFDAEWHVIPAGGANVSAGAPHRRERVWIIAYTKGNGRQQGQQDEGGGAEGIRPREERGFRNGNGDVADTASKRGRSRNPSGEDAADAGQLRGSARQDAGGMETGSTQPDLVLLANGIAARLARSRWLAEPGIGRVATGVPDRVQKLKALGNGLVWQIPYAIGRAIMEQMK